MQSTNVESEALKKRPRQWKLLLVAVGLFAFIGWRMHHDWQGWKSALGSDPTPYLAGTGQQHAGFFQTFPAQTGADGFRPIVVIPRSFPPITEIPLLDAEKANAKLHEAELVLGVTIGGQSRAYPINMLTGPQREILNDELNGVAIAATW